MNMTKAVLTVATAGLILGAARCSTAFTNEPGGFRGIKWGTDIKKLPRMKRDTFAFGRPIYSREGEELSMAGALLTGIDYYFYKGRFCATVVFFSGDDAYRAIKAEMFRRYGRVPESSEGSNQYYWKGKDVVIELAYKPLADLGRIIYVYLPLDRKRIEEGGENLFDAYGETDETLDFSGR